MARLSALMDADPAPGSAEEAELELLALVIQTYERIGSRLRLRIPLRPFCLFMDQQRLGQKDWCLTLARFLKCQRCWGQASAEPVDD